MARRSAVPARIAWAVEVLAPQSSEHVLEVGCGPGVAAALVCERLTTGRMLAVDRSSTAVVRTERRNAAHVESGRLEVRRATLADLDLDLDLDLAPAGFDAAFCVDVNLFWVADAARELHVLREALRPGGRLLVLYGGGPTGPDRVLGAVAAGLEAAGFSDVHTVEGEAGFGVRARC